MSSAGARTATVRMNRDQRRQQLLTVAEQAFSSNGYHTTSMNEVAKQAGVTKPVLYRHFASKRDLYLAVLEDCCDRLATAVVKATASAPSPHQQVEWGFRAYFEFVAGSQAAFTIMFADSSAIDPELHEPVRRLEANLSVAIADLIHADIDDPHRQLLSAGIVAMAEGMGQHCLAERLTIEPDRLAQQAADLAWAGLRGVKRV